MSDFDFRFGGIARLVSTPGLARLRQSHVCIIGVGGVGCWTAEALARSGVGTLTLIDMDELCVSNVNRQLHAMDGQIGTPKIEAMAARIRAINPECTVHTRLEFFTESNADAILDTGFDYVVDAIDSVKHKCHLITLCKQRNIPIITCGGAGGRRDPSQVELTDLGLTRLDPLLVQVRKTLRKIDGFPNHSGRKFRIDCVYSPEPPIYPQGDGTVCPQTKPGGDLRLNCDSGLGTATFITGAFGFMMAARVVDRITDQKAAKNSPPPASPGSPESPPATPPQTDRSPQYCPGD